MRPGLDSLQGSAQVFEHDLCLFREVAGNGFTVSAPSHLSRNEGKPPLQRYLDDWPDVQVEMSLSDASRTLSMRVSDLAIRIDVASLDRGLITRTIMSVEPILCAAPAYLKLSGMPATAEQLGFHDLLFFASQNGRQNWHLQDQDGMWVRAQGRSRLRLDRGEAIRDACLSGMGIALLPGFLINEDIASSRLHRVLPGVTAGVVNIMALYPPKRLLEPLVRHFIDILVEMLAESDAGSHTIDPTE
jgi:DNA-binding transcriptional LysR family regulator